MSDLLLIDLDGTLYTDGGAVDGAAEALVRLRADGHVLRFLTNTDSQPTPRLLARIADKGLVIGADELFSSLTAVETLLAAEPDPVVLPVTNDAVAAQLAERFSVCAPGDGRRPTHVVVGDVSDRLSYPLLDTAFRAVRSGAALVALQKSRFFLSGGTEHLDTGAVVAALEYATGVGALVAGKPSATLLQLAVASTGREMPPGRIWVVGDDVTTDVRMGRDAGVRTVLVRTGKFATHRDLTGVAVPECVLDSIADLPALIRSA